MKVPKMMKPACVAVQMVTVEITVKVSSYVIYIVQYGGHGRGRIYIEAID